MAAKGFIHHGLANRRKLVWLVLLYVLVIEAMAALIMTFLLAFFDPASIPFVNPAAYGVRYAAPVALISLGIFAICFFGHTNEIVRKLAIVRLANAHSPLERRYLTIAEQAATIAGLRRPSFGMIHDPALDALSVGSSRTAGLIVVTSGLVEALDDDELAAVIAHQAVHIRNGDTEIAAANHAFTRTAINLQVNNPLRIEDWRQILLVLALPFLLPALLAGGGMTMLAMMLARRARRGIALSRDAIADAEAVRITHFPEALISAIRRTAGRGGLSAASDLSGLMFSEGGATAKDSVAHARARISQIEEVAAELMSPGRTRADTRSQRRLFGQVQQQGGPAPAVSVDNNDVHLQPPPLRLLLTDTAEYRRLYRRFVDHWEWTEGKARNLFGLRPKAVALLAVAVAFLVGLHWPSDGDYARAARIFDPSQMLSLVHVQNSSFSSTSNSPEDAGGLNIFPDLSPESQKKQGYLMAIIALGLAIAAQVPGLRQHVAPHMWTKDGLRRTSRSPKSGRAPPQPAPPRPVLPRATSLHQPPSGGSDRPTSFEQRVEQRLRELALDSAASEPMPTRAVAPPQQQMAVSRTDESDRHQSANRTASPLSTPPFAGRRTFGTRQA
jgi:Zn-dependent protease with chaperone function